MTSSPKRDRGPVGARRTKKVPTRRGGSAIRRAFELTKALMRGDTFDRNSAAAVLQVAPPAAYRHLEAAREVLGLEVIESPTGKTYGMSTRSRTRIAAGDAQIVPLCLGAALAPVFAGSVYEGSLRAERDARARHAKRPRQHLERKFAFVPRGGECALPEQVGTLDEIVDALLNEERLSVEYAHFDGRLERLVLSPLTLLVYQQQLYLIAFRDELGDTRAYRFARLQNADRQGTFAYPTLTEYDPRLLFADAFGVFLNYDGKVERVRLKLDPRWATFVATHRWHSSQRVTPHPDGPLVELRVRVCPELVAWIRSFGAEARVVGPAKLRRRLAAAHG